MIYKFRIFSDINEKFLRCIEIDEEDTFLSLHEAIRTSVNFTKMEMASFYLSNDLWDRLTQITLMDVADGETDDIFTMENTHLNEFMTEEGENLVYVYDFISDRVFYLVLSEIKNRNASLKYPLCSQSIGDAPVQTMSEKRLIKSVTTGKILTSVKKSSTVVSSKTVAKVDKTSKDAKKTTAKKPVEPAKPVKVLKKDAKSAIIEKGLDKASGKIKETENKKLAKTTKSKKGKSFDDEEDDIDLDDLDLDDELPLKAAKGKKITTKPTKSRIAMASDDDDDDVDFDDDDDDDIDDDDLIDDVDEVDEDEDFSFDEEEFDSKFKTESTLYNDFDDEEDDLYDDTMFDNIDDYNDRL